MKEEREDFAGTMDEQVFSTSCTFVDSEVGCSSTGFYISALTEYQAGTGTYELSGSEPAVRGVWIALRQGSAPLSGI